LQELLAVPLTRVKTPDQKIEHGTRRAFLGAAAGLAGGFILRWIISPVSKRLRPPGAVAEDKFKTLCIRCGNCVRICPAKIIQHDTASPDTPGILAPMLGFSSDFCRADCNRCGQGCPSGAIAPLPLDAKNRRKIGLARIAMEDCLLTEGRECSICSLICPYNAIEEVFNQETYSYTLRVDPDRCNGCGQCQIVCPPKVIDIKPI
jgi:ferredoxin-type protein NapF